ncbi:hypothetical protein, partial [Allorhizocola rhizosphaerae]|uniref:hypothetical protein n=1 Tax=Allorhizocola rhizosphaerae TaxID=1872709 RepID=UPI001B8B7490
MTRQSPQSQVALISALVFALVGAGLLAVLVVGLLDGVRGLGALLLGALALGVFGLAFRLLLLSRNLRARPPASRLPLRQATPP